MAGKEKGVISSGNNIEAKYITNSDITAKNDIVVQKELMHCNVSCQGSINVEHGQLAGGHIIVQGGMKVKYLGSDAGAKTLIEVGLDDTLKERAEKTGPDVKVLNQKAAKVKQIVEPLLANQKHLNNEQKEKATELLWNASELESEAKKAIDDLRDAYMESREKAVLEIEVISQLYPGVTIRFPRTETKVSSIIKGPVKITTKRFKKMSRIIATDTLTGTSKTLDLGTSYDEQWDAIEAMIGYSEESDPAPKEND